MDIVRIDGPVPGRILATVEHSGRIHRRSLTVARHPAGGWHVQDPDGSFGPRCHSASTAILLDASDIFVCETERLAA